MGVRSAVRRHQDLLGDVVAVHHDRPGRGTVLGFISVWVALSALTLINPGETLMLSIAPAAGLFIIAVVIYVMLAGERLVVCERGVLVGSVAPFLRPYVIRYDQIVVGSVVPISAKISRFSKQTGLSAMPTVRTAWWSRRGVCFAGPSAAEARGSLGTSAPRAQAVGIPWLIGTRAPAEQATADIARAAEAAGFTELARQTVAAPPRALSGHAEDNPAQLPGVIVPGRR
ncbi:hypothetical protein [Glutamicibacter uratoxydans]|uniref:hypothetical protein n=1 Tax=Glutamicibacter uratoxydans TaxID=43667 RepID=UPI003D700570